MVDCYIAICRPACSAGVGVAGVPGVSGGERGGGVDVDAGRGIGIKNRRSGACAAQRECCASSTSSLTACDLFIDLYILPQSAQWLVVFVIRPTGVGWLDIRLWSASAWKCITALDIRLWSASAWKCITARETCSSQRSERSGLTRARRFMWKSDLPRAEKRKRCAWKFLMHT